MKYADQKILNKFKEIPHAIRQIIEKKIIPTSKTHSIHERPNIQRTSNTVKTTTENRPKPNQENIQNQQRNTQLPKLKMKNGHKNMGKKSTPP